MKIGHTIAVLGAALCLAASCVQAELQPPSGQPKYVFLFIGDGMGMAQVHAAEAYLDALANGKSDGNRDVKSTELMMTSELPYVGLSTTYCYDALITDSAAAGTALACGHKTDSGVISMSPDTSKDYPTIAEMAKDKGMKVGIVSSVSINHATPAVFYAHTPSRNQYHSIALQLSQSGFDYFGGGGFVDPVSGSVDARVIAEGNGYQIVTTREELEATTPGQKVLAYNHTLDGSEALYYEIDRPEDHISLAEFTAAGIRLMQDHPDGFFMMVEGGKVDWTCHANDARTSIDDVLALDDAIAEAVAFAQQHPDETLIVVTSDHETGGLTMGWAGTHYDSAYEDLVDQTMSYDTFTDLVEEYADSDECAWRYTRSQLADDDVLLTLIKDAFGFTYNSLSSFQREQLEAAYDRAMSGSASVGSEEDYLLYGDYNALTVTCTHILNANAGLGWTSYSHTASPVPVRSNSEAFVGFYDNTDIPKKIAAAIGVELLYPVVINPR